LVSYNTSTDALIRGQANHGFRGYPVNNFETARDPIVTSQSLNAKPSPRETHYGVPHHLDTSKIYLINAVCKSDLNIVNSYENVKLFSKTIKIEVV
jgi:hypothetical protein